jgi:hypothetical protein
MNNYFTKSYQVVVCLLSFVAFGPVLALYLNIPVIGQQTDYTCWTACTRMMIITYKNNDVTEQKILDYATKGKAVANELLGEGGENKSVKQILESAKNGTMVSREVKKEELYKNSNFGPYQKIKGED